MGQLAPFASLGELIEGLGNSSPGDPALTMADRVLRRGDVTALSRIQAARWQSAGLGRGEVVGIIGDTGPAIVLALLSASRAGLVPLLLDPGLTPDEARAVLERAAPRAFACCAGSRWTRTLDRPVYMFDHDGGCSLPDATGGVPPPLEQDPHAPALLLVTSGTSGHPRVVSLSAGNVSSNLRSGSRVHSGDRSDVCLSLLPLTHAFELVTGLIGPLHAGASVVFPESRNPRSVLDVMRSARVTRFNVVPAVLHMLHAEIQTAGGFVAAAMLKHRLRAIVCGGAAPAPELVTRLVRAGVPLWLGYGLTEASPTVALGRAADLPRGSAGRALPDVELSIEAETGELLVRGPNIMLGYYGDPIATSQVISNGWLRTGDLARIDAAGHLFILGRRRELIVTGAGFKLLPDDVEAAYRSTLFAEVCAVGVPDADAGGETPCLVIVPAADDAAVAAEFRRLSVLAGARRARRLEISRAALPRTRTLKLRRDLVRQAVLIRQEADHVHA